MSPENANLAYFGSVESRNLRSIKRHLKAAGHHISVQANNLEAARKKISRGALEKRNVSVVIFDDDFVASAVGLRRLVKRIDPRITILWYAQKDPETGYNAISTHDGIRIDPAFRFLSTGDIWVQKPPKGITYTMHPHKLLALIAKSI